MLVPPKQKGGDSMLVIRTKDNFYPNCTVQDDAPRKLDNSIVFTSESKAGKVRTVELAKSEITAFEESEE